MLCPVVGLLVAHALVIGAAPAAEEPPAPRASEAVQSLLNQANLSPTNPPGDALRAADRALTVARESGDIPGEAYAHRRWPRYDGTPGRRTLTIGRRFF